jgi:hypothetical protein
MPSEPCGSDTCINIHELEQLRKQVETLQDRLSDIISLCWGYDGFNDVQGLKSLIDDVVKYAKGEMETIEVKSK